MSRFRGAALRHRQRRDDLLVELVQSGHRRQIDRVTSTSAHRDDLDRVGSRFIGEQSVDDSEALRPLTGEIELESSSPDEIAGDVPLAECLSDLPPLGEIDDGLHRSIDEGVILMAERLEIRKDLGQKQPVERLGHGAQPKRAGSRPNARATSSKHNRRSPASASRSDASMASRWSSMAGKSSSQRDHDRITPWGRRWLPKVTGSADAP